MTQEKFNLEAPRLLNDMRSTLKWTTKSIDHNSLNAAIANIDDLIKASSKLKQAIIDLKTNTKV